MITMAEIARLTGVSQPTVSRVLNGNTSVNPEIVKKVMACAREHNYQPNMIARSLNGSRTCLLAVIVPDISNPFFADIIKNLEHEAEKEGYSILIFNSEYSQKKERKCLELIQQYRVDGLFLVPLRTDEEGICPFRQLTIPWLIITKHAEGVHSVFISHKKAGQVIARHMTEIPVQKYIFVGKKTDSKYIGFVQGLREQQVDIEKNLIDFWDMDKEKMLERLVSFVQRETHRVGIFAFNDVEALIVMNALLGAGVDIPGKAVLVGFDNTFISQKMIPGITSVDQHIDEMCQTAIKELLGLMHHDGKKTVRHIEIEAELAVRASSKIEEQ